VEAIGFGPVAGFAALGQRRFAGSSETFDIGAWNTDGAPDGRIPASQRAEESGYIG
jgi:hypothetical protein